MKKMNKNIFFTAILILTSFSFSYAETFRFQYNEGDSYRILSTVQENVYFNGELSHRSEIINRISVKVTDVDSEGNGIHEAHFMTSENAVGEFLTKTYTWGEEYESYFSRTPNGTYKISDEYFMPVVRDVPIFPDHDIQIGEKWTAVGHEAHDLRKSFGIEKPFKVPFTANYEYSGDIFKEGKKYNVIKASYTLYYNSPKVKATAESVYPVTTMGFSDQTILWDSERGMISSYSEKFRIQIDTNRGDTFIFQGTASAEVSDIQRVKNSETLAKVQEQIEQLGITDTEIKTNDKGITISIENIQFNPNSAYLKESEKEKLRKIAEILKAFPDNDLLVVGHTALSGTPESCQKLSEERAYAVADFLINEGAKDERHIFTKGKGASEPIASNATKAGMAKNRRVEITIMEQ